MGGISIDQDWGEGPVEYHDQGPRALLWAVFASGIESYCRAIENGAVYGAEFRETERWVFSNETGLTSFPTLCDIFGFDARTLRLRLIDFREKPDRALAGMLRADAA